MQFFKSSEKDGGSRPSRRSATNGGLRQYLNTKSSPAILVEEADIPLTESSTVRAIAKVAVGENIILQVTMMNMVVSVEIGIISIRSEKLRHLASISHTSCTISHQEMA